MTGVGIVILAAGASTRLGRPKQSLLFRGQTLLQHAVQAALQSGGEPIIVVLGAQADFIRDQIDLPEINIIENPDWEEGMGASIRHGVAALLKACPTLNGIILMLCDQPLVSGELLQKLMLEQEISFKQIIACSYQNTMGTPVFFSKQFFPDLLALHGTHGAKKLLYQYPEAVATIPFELGAFDIDTVSDYNSLLHYWQVN